MLWRSIRKSIMTFSGSFCMAFVSDILYNISHCFLAFDPALIRHFFKQAFGLAFYLTVYLALYPAFYLALYLTCILTVIWHFVWHVLGSGTAQRVGGSLARLLPKSLAKGLTQRIFLSECDWGSLAKSIETWPCGAPACQTSKRAIKCKLFGTRPSALHRSCAPEIQTWVCEGFSMWQKPGYTDIRLPRTRPQFPLPRTVPRYNSLPQRFREHIYCWLWGKTSAANPSLPIPPPIPALFGGRPCRARRRPPRSGCRDWNAPKKPGGIGVMFVYDVKMSIKLIRTRATIIGLWRAKTNCHVALHWGRVANIPIISIFIISLTKNSLYFRYNNLATKIGWSSLCNWNTVELDANTRRESDIFTLLFTSMQVFSLFNPISGRSNNNILLFLRQKFPYLSITPGCLFKLGRTLWFFLLDWDHHPE